MRRSSAISIPVSKVNVTLPVGVPPGGVVATVAVNVTDSPKTDVFPTAEEERLVVVSAAAATESDALHKSNPNKASSRSKG